MIAWLQRLFAGKKRVNVAAMDARTKKNIASLDSKAQPVFGRLWEIGNAIAKEHGCTYVMISGNRTYKEQNYLYAQGRTRPGNKVTNAKGGYSNHNFGIAGDFGVFKDGVYMDSKSPDLAYKVHKAVQIAANSENLNVEWGGNWKLADYPHFELKTGLTMAQKRARMDERNSVL